MKIIPLVAADIDLIKDLQPEGWPDIFQHLWFYTAHSFCHPFKFITGARIAGIGTAIFHNEVAWLAHIIVYPQFRNKGIGSEITKFLMDFSFKNGIKTINLIATDLGFPVYEKCGFEIDTEYNFYKDISSSKLSISKKVRKANRKELNEILKLDRSISGEDRSLYIKSNTNNIYLYLVENKIEGVYFPDWGEGLIIADTPEAGAALMNVRLQHHDKAVLPEENITGNQHLQHLGVLPFRKAKRMTMGEKIIWHPEKMYNRIGGNIG